MSDKPNIDQIALDIINTWEVAGVSEMIFKPECQRKASLQVLIVDALRELQSTTITNEAHNLYMKNQFDSFQVQLKADLKEAVREVLDRVRHILNSDVNGLFPNSSIKQELKIIDLIGGAINKIRKEYE